MKNNENLKNLKTENQKDEEEITMEELEKKLEELEAENLEKSCQ